jgi:hypothetical protein
LLVNFLFTFVIASVAKQSWANCVRLNVHFVNFPFKGGIVRGVNNYQGNHRLSEISHVALRVPRKDILNFVRQVEKSFEKTVWDNPLCRIELQEAINNK